MSAAKSASAAKLASPVVAFDIEVAGLEWEEVDEATRHYLMAREKRRNPKGGAPDVEALQHRLALVRGMGRVVSIGMWNLDKDQGAVLVHGSGCKWEDFDVVPGTKVFRGNERELLQEFWKQASKWGTVVTYNGRAYDGPVLITRSAMLDVKPSRQFCGYRYRVDDHCDLMDLLNFQGAARDSYSLDYWCRRFGVESPKGKMDGSMVANRARDGRYDEIAEYCLRDTRATADLFRRLENTLVPLF
ncbi:MAG: ribonuclease H-like domain-containing protein [Planctomycetes bacterium]|nr:ribonuclease H-like domain-containing protein [Planctomycetota bacterium]